MFAIFLREKRLPKFKFYSYEEARSAARKLIRKQPGYEGWFESNPAISYYGYSIKQV